MGDQPSKLSSRSNAAEVKRRAAQASLAGAPSGSRDRGRSSASAASSITAPAWLTALAKAQKALKLAKLSSLPAPLNAPELRRLAYKRAVKHFTRFFDYPEAKNHKDYGALQAEFVQAKLGLAQFSPEEDSDYEEAQEAKEAKVTQPPTLAPDAGRSLAAPSLMASGGAQGGASVSSEVGSAQPSPEQKSVLAESRSSMASESKVASPVEDKLEIFRHPTPVPEMDFVDVDRPIQTTRDLTAVLRQLPADSPRIPALSALSLEIVNQFGLRLVRTPALLAELTALGGLPQTELLNKILQQFVNRLNEEAALDVDLLEGLAVLLETAHPQALRASLPVGEAACAEKSEEKVEEKVEDQKAEQKESASALERAKQIGRQGATAAANLAQEMLNSGDSSEALTVVGKKAMAVGVSAFNSLREAVQRLMGSQASESSAAVDHPAALEGKQPVASEPTLPVSRYNNIQYLLVLLKNLNQKYADFHRQVQTEAQEVGLLRSLARVLDALRDIGVTGISKEQVRKVVYDTLVARANDREASVLISLWANYAIQALIRLEDDGSAMGEWFQRGKNVVKLVGALKQFWGNWDIEQLGEAYQNAKDAFHVDHQPQAWYEALWYCQLLIRSYEFQTLETYLYGQSPCPQRFDPPFQLGLLLALDTAIRDPQASESVRTGCLQLIQKLFVEESHWHVSDLEPEIDQSQFAQFQGLVQQGIERGKKLLLYRGRAYHLVKESVQAAALDQLMQYLSLPELADSVQPLLLALRDPSMILTASQTTLLNRHAPLHKILQGSQKSSEKPAPNTVLLTAAQEVVQKQLVWKLENLRTRALGDVETQRVLSAYVPPKGLVRLGADKEPDPTKQESFDLLQSSLAFLGLSSRDPAQDSKKALVPKKAKADPELEDAVPKADEKSGADEGELESKPERSPMAPGPSTRPRRSSMVVSEQDLAQCVIDVRRVPGPVDKAQVMLWRQTYASQFTRFFLVLTQTQQAPADRRWYFCGQTGEGEWLEGGLPIPTEKVEAKDDPEKMDQYSVFEQLAVQLEPDRQQSDGWSMLPVDRLMSLKRWLIECLGHTVIVNGQPKAIKEPKEAPSAQVLLLTAGAGSGKSTYGRYLEKHLWQHYATGGYIPLFINLTQLARPDKPFIDDYFKQLGFSTADIAQLKDPKNGYRFLLIFDGYDELVSLKGQNLFKLNQLQDWPCKVIIGCRSEALQGQYAAWFVPQRGQQQDYPEGLVERWIAPFDDAQIQHYLKKYIHQQLDRQAKTGEVWQGWNDPDRYWQQIQALGSIRELVSRPFMLTILVEVLPAMLKAREGAQGSASLSQITRLDLYEMFMQQWFQREKDKLSAVDWQEAKRYGQERFRFQEGEPIEQDYQEFCENLAAYLFEANQATASYQPRWEVAKMGSQRVAQPLDRFFKISDPAVRLVLRGTPILPQGKNRYGYLHKSIWEYFVACRIYHELSWAPIPWGKQAASLASAEAKGSPRKPEGQKRTSGHSLAVSSPLSAERPRMSLALKRFNQRLTERHAAQAAIVRLQERDPLKQLISQRLLNSEPSILQFLVDFAAHDERFQKTLLYWVLCSCTQPELSIASANAITILNIARFSFSGMNLSSIRVRGADLSRALLDHTDLSKADLRDVNFAHAFLRGTRFQGSRLEGAFFEPTGGQEVSMGALISGAPYDEDGVYFVENQEIVFFLDQNRKEVRVYDTRLRQFLVPLRAVEGKKISCVECTPDGRLAFFSWLFGSHIYIYDVESRKLLDLLQASRGGEMNREHVFSNHIQLAFFGELYNGGYQIYVYDVVLRKLVDTLTVPETLDLGNGVVTPDNRLIFFHQGYGFRGCVYVYDADSRKWLEPLRSPEGENKFGEINKIIFTPDNRLAFLHDCLGSRKVLVYDLISQKLLEILDAGEKEKVHRIGITPNSKLAFFEHGKGQLRIYDIVSQKLLEPLKIADISEVVITPNSQLAFFYQSTFHRGKQFWVYDIVLQELLTPLQIPGIEEVIISPNCHLAFLCSYVSGYIYLYDIRQRKLLESLQIPGNEKINKITFTPDNCLAFLYNSQGSSGMHVYDMNSQKLSSIVMAFKGERINEVVVMPNARLAFLYFRDPEEGVRQVYVYDYHGQQALSVHKFVEPIYDLRIFADRNQGVALSYYHCYILNVKDSVVQILLFHKRMNEQIKDVRLLANGDLWIQGENSSYQAWRWETSEVVVKSSLIENNTKHFSSFRAGHKLSATKMLSFSDREVNIWQVQKLNLVFDNRIPHPLYVCKTSDNCFAFLYPRIAEESYQDRGEENREKEERRIWRYDVISQKLLEPLQFANEINAVVITPDNRLAFFYNYKRGPYIYVYNIALRKVVQSIISTINKFKEEIRINAVTITPDNCSAFLYNHDSYIGKDESRIVFVYDITSQDSPLKFSKPIIGRINRVKVTPDSRLAFLYYAQGDKCQIQVYDVISKKLLEPLQVVKKGEKDGYVRGIKATPDSRLVFLYGWDNYQIFVYDTISKIQLLPWKAPKDEEIDSMTITPDGSLAFLYNGFILSDDQQQGGQHVFIYDVASHTLVGSLKAPEGETINEVTLTETGRLAFLSNLNRLLMVYSCVGRRQIPLDLGPLNVLKFLELSEANGISEVSEVKKSKSNYESILAGVFYGTGGCYLWLIQTNKIIPLIKNSEITFVEYFPGANKQLRKSDRDGMPLRLLTGGSDGTLRLWDISDLERPLLKCCTRGLTFYAQGAQFDAQTKLSADNARVLRARGAIMVGEAAPEANPHEIKGHQQEAKRELKGVAGSDDLATVEKSHASLVPQGLFFQEVRRNPEAQSGLEEKRPRTALLAPQALMPSAVSPSDSSAQLIAAVGLPAKPKIPPAADASAVTASADVNIQQGQS